MKKNLLILTIFSAAMLLLASCKTHERCPAYGKINQPKTTTKSV
jgi:hypothetical protein